MDVLKQKLNDIGSCIGYPFYFFEDGSYSKSIVNGKMNAMVIVKKPFLASQGSCFFYVTGNEAQKQQVREKWAQKEQENTAFKFKNSLSWLQKNVNDLGDCIGYPYYILDDGNCVLNSDERKKVAAVIVRKAFEVIDGDNMGIINSDPVNIAFSPAAQEQKPKPVLPPKVDDDKTHEINLKIKHMAVASWVSYEISDDDLLYMLKHGQIEALKEFLTSGIDETLCERDFSKYCVFAAGYPKTMEEIVKLQDFDLFKFFMADKRACNYCSSWVYTYGTTEMLEYILTDTDGITILSHPTILIEKNNAEGYRLFCKSRYKDHVNILAEYECLLRMKNYDLFKILLEEEFKYTGEFTREMFANWLRNGDIYGTLDLLFTSHCSKEFMDLFR